MTKGSWSLIPMPFPTLHQPCYSDLLLLTFELRLPMMPVPGTSVFPSSTFSSPNRMGYAWRSAIRKYHSDVILRRACTGRMHADISQAPQGDEKNETQYRPTRFRRVSLGHIDRSGGCDNSLGTLRQRGRQQQRPGVRTYRQYCPYLRCACQSAAARVERFTTDQPGRRW